MCTLEEGAPCVASSQRERAPPCVRAALRAQSCRAFREHVVQLKERQGTQRATLEKRAWQVWKVECATRRGYRLHREEKGKHVFHGRHTVCLLTHVEPMIKKLKKPQFFKDCATHVSYFFIFFKSHFFNLFRRLHYIMPKF